MSFPVRASGTCLEVSLCAAGESRFKSKRVSDEYFFYILNNVKHIQDYYAPIVGEFEHFVLLALVRLGNGTYGAAIRREIRERTTRELPVGTVYMTLGRLEKKEMIASYVGNPSAQRGGRRRRHYLIDGRREGARPLLSRVQDDERGPGTAARVTLARSTYLSRRTVSFRPGPAGGRPRVVFSTCALARVDHDHRAPADHFERESVDDHGGALVDADTDERRDGRARR